MNTKTISFWLCAGCALVHLVISWTSKDKHERMHHGTRGAGYVAAAFVVIAM